MLATIPESREVDFSHLQVELANVELVESVANSPAHARRARLFLFALILSLLAHLSLLLFEFGAQKSSPEPVLSQTLRVNLVQAPIAKPETLTEAVPEIVPKMASPEIAAVQPDVAPPQEVATLPAPVKSVVTVEQPRELKPAARRIIEPLSVRELAEIVDANQQRPDSEDDAAIARNVFHPELRKKLTTASKEQRKQRIEDQDEDAGYIDPSGAYRVKTGMGTCLSSPPNNSAGTPRNWYVSLCKGKSESEKMMERVDEDMNGKLYFDK